MISKLIGLLIVAVVSVGIAGAAYAAPSATHSQAPAVLQIAPGVAAPASALGSVDVSRAVTTAARLAAPAPAQTATEIANPDHAVQVAKGDDDDDDDDDGDD